MKARKAQSQPRPCPCGSGQTYDQCCAPWHNGQPAPTPEALMRSRYSAYVLGLEDYLLATWAPDTRPPSLDLATPPLPQWVGLEILARAGGTEGETETGTVHYRARYKLNGRAHRLEEISRFRKTGERWVYVDGEIRED